MFLNFFLFYQVVGPLVRKSVNKYLYLYLKIKPSHLLRIFVYLEAKGGSHIVMKFSVEVGVHDIITIANSGDDRFRGF